MQLTSPRYREREEATRELIRRGPSVVPLLEEYEHIPNLERQRRIERILPLVRPQVPLSEMYRMIISAVKVHPEVRQNLTLLTHVWNQFSPSQKTMFEFLTRDSYSQFEKLTKVFRMGLLRAGAEVVNEVLIGEDRLDSIAYFLNWRKHPYIVWIDRSALSITTSGPQWSPIKIPIDPTFFVPRYHRYPDGSPTHLPAVPIQAIVYITYPWRSTHYRLEITDESAPSEMEFDTYANVGYYLSHTFGYPRHPDSRELEEAVSRWSRIEKETPRG